MLPPRRRARTLWLVAHRFTTDFIFNRFIFRRGRTRGLAHWLIMAGCVVALAVTIPLVFGWVEFRTESDDLGRYRVYAFGVSQAAFPIDSVMGFVTFHALVWPSLLIVAGVFLAMRRRLRDEGAAALQQFSEDFLPLILLFAVSATGLMLTASYTWMKGYAYDFLSILHAVSVIFTLLWLPFGKLFHIFQRPAHLAVAVYKDAGRRGEQAECRRCGAAFASLMHVQDLIMVERQLGYRYETKHRRPGALSVDLPALPAGAVRAGAGEIVGERCSGIDHGRRTRLGREMLNGFPDRSYGELVLQRYKRRGDSLCRESRAARLRCW